MFRIASLLVFIQLFAGFAAIAQDKHWPNLPKLHPSNTTLFDIDAGLPISCTSNGLIDQAGRLWINPCFGQEEHRTVGFYQFDGTQSIHIEWGNIPEALEGKQAVLSGFTKSGALFGFFRYSSTGFFINPDTRKPHFYTLGEADGTITFQGITEAYGIILYALSPTQHRVYRLNEDVPQLLLEVPRSNPTTEQPNEAEHYPVLTETDIWFSDFISYDQPNPDQIISSFGSIIKANLATRTIRKYTLHDLFPSAPQPSFPDINREFTADPNGRILIHLVGWDYFVQIDPSNGTIQPIYPFQENRNQLRGGPIPEFRSLTRIDKDQVGNLLFYQKDGPGCRAVLLDKEGRYYDYTPVLLAALEVSRFERASINQVIGKDFRRQAYLFMSSGLTAVELQLSGPIKNSLNAVPVRAIAEITPKQFMVLPEGIGRLMRFNPETDLSRKSTSPVLFDCFDEKQPNLRHMVNIVKDTAGNFWTPYKKQLVRFQATGQCSSFPVGVEFMKFAFLNEKTIILEDGGKFYQYHLPNQKLSPLLVNGLNFSIADIVNQIYVSKDKIVWIASLSGLYRIDPATGNGRLIERPEGFQDKRMMCIDEDEQGRLWIGTYGGGLHIYSPKTGAVTIIDQKQGLSNNIVVGILADEAGVRWLSTYKGITLVSEQGKVLTRLFDSDGLSTNEFNRYSYYKSSTGDLLFGSINGINYIEPEAVKAQILNAAPLQIYLTGLSYFDPGKDSLINQTHWPSSSKPIQLAATHRYLSLRFALSRLVRREENRFAYRLIGPDIKGPDEWIYIGTNSELNLQGLPAGSYKLLVRGSDYRGNWTTQPLVIPIQAAEFFYRQTWFIVLCFLLLFSLAAGWLYRQKIEQKRLEKELSKRTEEIMRARDQLVVQEKLASLGQLTAGIAHEIKNPLNFVNNFALDSSKLADRLIDNLEKIKSKIDAKEYDRMLHYLQDMKQNVLDIKSSGSTADRIVRSMMDHARGNSETMQLLDLNLLLEETAHLAISGFKASRPDFLIRSVEKFDAAAPQVYGSPLNLSRAFLNILNNACYALYENQLAKNGAFKAELQVQTQVKDDFIEIRIRDNGPGIPPEIIKDIFTPFFTTKPTGTGNTGLGLSICFDIIVNEHSGMLTVNSEPRVYTEFVAQIPTNTVSPM